MKPEYLIDEDKDLAETLLGRTDEMKSFNEKSHKEKITFIESVLKRLKPYLDANEYGEIEEGIISGLGNSWNEFLNALKIYSCNNHVVQIGWNCEHGRVFQYFENSGGIIHVSYYSEGHPVKEFKEIWEFNKHTIKMREICKTEVTGEITPICEAIKDFMVKA